MDELEHDRAGTEPSTTKTHAEASPASAAPARDGSTCESSSAGDTVDDADDMPQPREPEFELPPVWETPDDRLESSSDQSEEAWAFLQDAPEEGDIARSTRASHSAEPLGRALIQRLFRPDWGPLLASIERALRAGSGRDPSARPLLQLVSRARAAGASEPRLLEALLRAHATGRLGEDYSVLGALLARRLVLPSLRGESRVGDGSQRRRLFRDVLALVKRVSRARGARGLHELARLSARVGARAAERGQPRSELVPLLARAVERRAPARSNFEFEAGGSSRTRRFRLPGRVEIVIYEE